METNTAKISPKLIVIGPFMKTQDYIDKQEGKENIQVIYHTLTYEVFMDNIIKISIIIYTPEL